MRKNSAVHVYLAKIGKKGDQTRAAKYSKAILSEWGKLGARPRKA